MSVIILALPLVNILMLPGTILLMGTTLLIAPAFGNQDYRRVNRILTVGLASALVISGIFTALLAVFAEPVSLFITRDARLQPMLQAYLPFAFVGSFFGLFACAGSQFVQISGRPRLVAWFVGIFGVLNLALDILFVRVLEMGIRGAAAGTSAAMTGVSMIILNLGLNTLVLRTLGADGMFTLSICMQLLMICMLVLTATGGTITGLGGILSGEEDWDGVGRLISLILRLSLGMLLPMLGGLSTSAILSRREGKLHPVWLIPVGDTRHSFTVSVAYSNGSVARPFLLLCERLEAMGLPQHENTAITHCVEEMMLHQLEMGQSCGLKGSFDVGIVDGDHRFTILVKAAGKAFNPLRGYGQHTPDSLSLRIVEGFCRDVNYRYASGVNCVYLNFDKH